MPPNIYLNGLSAIALVIRAIVLPSSSLVSTGQTEDWLSSINLTFSSSIWDGVNWTSSFEFFPLAVAFSPVQCWRNCCLFFNFWDLHWFLKNLCRRSFYFIWKRYRKYSFSPNTTSVSLVLFKLVKACETKLLAEDWAIAVKSFTDNTNNASSSSTVVERDSTWIYITDYGYKFNIDLWNDLYLPCSYH